ncbi:MAG: hypothetical protein FWD69_20070 [Polyangiaceae bacterium]|nr:hypothetical protein [Polyangiaceae bacterium]
MVCLQPDIEIFNIHTVHRGVGILAGAAVRAISPQTFHFLEILGGGIIFWRAGGGIRSIWTLGARIGIHNVRILNFGILVGRRTG